MQLILCSLNLQDDLHDFDSFTHLKVTDIFFFRALFCVPVYLSCHEPFLVVLESDCI